MEEDTSASPNGAADWETTAGEGLEAEEGSEKEVFVRRVSELMEACGHPPIAGGIMGWLLVSDPAEQTFGELVETTGASKGSISTMTRRLERAGLIERVSRTGDRQSYFRLQPGVWRTVLRRHMALVRNLAAAAEYGLEEIQEQTPSVRRRLQEMRAYHAFVSEKMPALVEEYEADSEIAE